MSLTVVRSVEPARGQSRAEIRAEPPRPLLDLRSVPNLGTALRDAMVPHKSNVALIELDREVETRRLTYAQAGAEANAVGARLRAAGLGPGARVAILMSNQSRWLTSALGVLWSGTVLLPIDAKLEPAEIGALFAHARPRGLLVEYGLFKRLSAAGVTLPERVWVSEAPAGADLGAARSWDEPAPVGFVPSEPARDDVAALVYSSGTGGEPKGCLLTHGNYLAQAEILGNLFPMHESDRFFSILPTNHAIDFMCGFIVPWLFGAAVVHQRTLRPHFLASTLRRQQITHMALVPLVLRALRERFESAFAELSPLRRSVLDGLIALNRAATLRRPEPALSRRLLAQVHKELGGRLRLMVCGGARVEPDDAQFFYDLGVPVAVGYGLTEACTVVSVNDLHPFRADSVGKPVPGVEVDIREPGADGVGEVWVRGPTVMTGYLDAPELTAETLHQGWLRTGDLGRLDAAGHLVLVGRRKNMIVTAGGKNVYPEDVESTFAGLAGAAEVCVLARDYIWPRRGLIGEELCLVVREAEGARVAIEDIIARNRRLAVHKRVARVLLWSSAFPRTASLKLRRAALAEVLRDRFDAAQLRPLD